MAAATTLPEVTAMITPRVVAMAYDSNVANSAYTVLMFLDRAKEMTMMFSVYECEISKNLVY